VAKLVDHNFASAKAAASDATLVDGPKWNAGHDGFEAGVLTSDLTFVSTTTLTSVTGFSFAIPLSERWGVRLYLAVNMASLASQGFDFGWTGPTGCLITRAHARGPATTISTLSVTGFAGTAMATKQVGVVIGANALSNAYIEYVATITNSTTAGTMQFQMTTKVSAASGNTLLAGSHMEAFRLA
jgi:hypothetical protein